LQYQNDDAGTNYHRARTYDPLRGKFMQEDPLGVAGGLSSYGFVNGDPVNYADPFGLLAELNGAGMDCRKVPCPPPKTVVTNPTVIKRGQEMYKQTLKDGKERGAFLFNGPNGTIRVGPTMVGTAFDPNTGRAMMPQMTTAPDDAIGEIHSHPPLAGVDGPSGFDAANGNQNNIMTLVRDKGGLFILNTNGSAAYQLPLPTP
jgi:RHS repeat-associated protein